MAMAWSGKNRHYRWSIIQPRHIASTGARAGLRSAIAQSVTEDIAARAPEAIARVAREIPDGFPARIADPILSGVEAKAREIRSG